jgi:hypothetical protein
MASTPHPFYPPDLVLPGYVPNELDALSLIGIFASGSILLLSVAILINDGLKGARRMALLWFILCEYSMCFCFGVVVSGWRGGVGDFLERVYERLGESVNGNWLTGE